MTAPDVRWFRWDMGGISDGVLNGGDNSPTNPARGSLIRILKACLVTGFNEQTVDMLSYDQATGLVTVTFPNDHGFLQYQTIKVTNSQVPEFNGEFIVEDVPTPKSLRFRPDSTPSQYQDISRSATIKTPPIPGWTMPFANDDESEAVFKPTSEQNNVFYKLTDNLIDMTSYGGNYHFVKVEAFNDMIDISTGNFWASGWWKKGTRIPGVTYTEKWVLVGDRFGFFLNLSNLDDKLYDAIYYLGSITSFDHTQTEKTVPILIDSTTYYYRIGFARLHKTRALTPPSTPKIFLQNNYENTTQGIEGMVLLHGLRPIETDYYLFSNSPSLGGVGFIQTGIVCERNTQSSSLVESPYIRGYFPNFYVSLSGKIDMTYPMGTVVKIGSRRYIMLHDSAVLTAALDITENWDRDFWNNHLDGIVMLP